jgi:hypothetical protein
MAILTWLGNNWFTLLQTVSIVGALLFTAISLRIDAKVRRIANLFEATKQHREIWTLLYNRSALHRVRAPQADLSAVPVTDEERLFVNFVILHFASNYRAARAGMFSLPQAIRSDMRAFFSRPVPRAVWEMMRRFQEKDFVEFVDGETEGITR